MIVLSLSLLLACGDKDADSGSPSGNTDTTDDGSSDGGSSIEDGGATDGAASDGGTSDGGTTGPAEVHTLEPAELATWLSDGTDLLLINTHIPYAGEIPGTDLHVAYTDEAALIDAIGSDLDRLTVVYCKTGPMSATAAEGLVEAGYRNIWDLPAGMNGWESAGYELDP